MAQITGTGSIDFAYIGHIILLTLGLYLLSASFRYVQGWIMAGVSTNITYRFRTDISEKINRMPLALLRRHQPRRGALAHHQRRGYGQPDPQPEPDADHHLGGDRGRRAGHDVLDQLA